MQRKNLVLLACSVLLFVSAACSGTDEKTANVAPDRNASPHASPADASASTEVAAPATMPPAEVVRASTSELKMRAGGEGVAEVRLDIAAGYHVNANPPTHKYLIPTSLEITPVEGITTGVVAYPKSLTKKFAFDPQPLAVYETEATIRLPLRVAAATPAGEHTLPARVRVQPCDHQACYPPRTVDAFIKVVVN